MPSTLFSKDYVTGLNLYWMVLTGLRMVLTILYWMVLTILDGINWMVITGVVLTGLRFPFIPRAREGVGKAW